MTTDHHSTHPWPAAASQQALVTDGHGAETATARAATTALQPDKVLKPHTPFPERVWKVLVWGAMGFFSSTSCC